MTKKQKFGLKRFLSLAMSAVTALSVLQVGGRVVSYAQDNSQEEEVSADNLNIVSNANAYKNYIKRFSDAAKPMEEITVDMTKFSASNGAECELVDFEGE